MKFNINILNGFISCDDNIVSIKKDKIFLTGELAVASKSDLISYISDSQIHDLPENMRFIDTELKGPVFCLNDDLELICFKRKSK